MMNRLMIAAAAVALTTPLAVAGPIDSACIRSERAASPRLFRNADEAQEIRMSKSDADNAFWARYKNFAATAEAYCSN